MMHCISKLYRLPITVQHLRDTGVGRTVNSLRKFDGGVGDAAKALVAKWKTMVANEDSSDPEDEDEACVPDAPESYSSTPESPKRDENSENGVHRHSSQESKERHKSKSSKSGSSSHGSKHSSKSHSSSEVTNCKGTEKPSVQKEKHSRTTSKVHEQRHESKSRSHSSKHDSDSSDSKSKSSKDLPVDSKRGHDSKVKSRVHSDVGKVSSSTESVTVNGKDSHRKRKQERSDDKMPTKKTKYSESESEEDNSRLVINSPTLSESQSPSIGTESVGSIESEAVSKKSSQLSDKTSSRKESNGKDRKRDKKKGESRHKSKAEVEKEIQKEKDSKKDDKRRKENHSSSKHSSKSKSSHSSSSRKDSTKQNDLSEGITSQSGTSFADALEMCMLPPPTRKRGGNTLSTSTVKSIKVVPEASTSESKLVSLSAKMKTEDTNLDTNPLSLLGSNVKLDPLNVDLAATLPEISPNYRPLPSNLNPVNRKFEEDKSLSEVIYSKNMRTKVFSGNKTGYPTVPSLSDVCIRVLIENIDALEVTGGVPFYIIKPVLERANPDQLYMLEHHNPYLIEDTDSLWQFHCNREFRTKSREEMESWREMYMVSN